MEPPRRLERLTNRAGRSRLEICWGAGKNRSRSNGSVTRGRVAASRAEASDRRPVGRGGGRDRAAARRRRPGRGCVAAEGGTVTGTARAEDAQAGAGIDDRLRSAGVGQVGAAAVWAASDGAVA